VESVAVVIPCFNSSAFVGEAVESALAQTYQPLEVLVVNDGSTDASADVLRRYAGRIRVIDQDNQGLAAARNAGIDATTSTYIAFLDADDRWRCNKIATQVEYLRSHPQVSLVFCDRSWIDTRGEPIAAPQHRRPVTPSLQTLIAGNFIQPSTVLLRREALAHERFDRAMPGTEDWDLWLRLAVRCEFAYLAEPLVEYRVHGTNMSGRTEQMMRGFLTTLTRATARGLPPEAAAAADAHKRALLEALGHCAYERDDWQEARRLFREARVGWSGPARLRLTLASLPDPLRTVVHRLKSGLARARSTSVTNGSVS
jgi:teichuronic acid biosynthesis glycosyltransferase TuaG